LETVSRDDKSERKANHHHHHHHHHHKNINRHNQLVAFVYILLHEHFKIVGSFFFWNNGASNGVFVGCQLGATLPPVTLIPA
jgi:hypothetical protein